MRKKVIFGNWKMFKTNKEAIEFIQDAENKLKLPNNYVAGIAAPFTALSDLKKVSKNIIICAQNCHFKTNGAYTGEISIPMLKGIGITHVIIGHSERREMFAETSETVNEKLKSLLNEGLTPVFCCGESLEIYESKKTIDFIKEQIIKGFKDIKDSDAEKVIVAYEPIWAIGTGKTASPEQAQDVIKSIRDILSNIYTKDVASKIIIQYGGSVNPKNVNNILSQPDIDGALVGGSSIEVSSFLELFKTNEK
ncbi:triose-phosphate isomerase [Spiroplasma endosymbiont of Aspidapion aeneum]|uniref:triose-phosphate isomerase n=1 Tax=Spiroplasma endosymbiont of Aspidapion aeneum TaxID=3066276 RepID=UPI00313AA5B6